MIRSLHIENFKGYADFRLNDLGRVTLLGGRNNVGKTSLLEGLFLLDDRANPGLFMRQHSWRGITSVMMAPETLWAPCFTGYDLARPMVIESTDESGKTEKLTLSFNPLFHPPIAPVMFARTQIPTNGEGPRSQALDINFQRDGQLAQVSHLLLDGAMHVDFMQGGGRPAVFLPSTQRVSPQDDAANFGRIDLEGRKDEITAFLRETVEPRLSDLTTIVVGNMPLIHAQMEGFPRKLPVAYMGEGMSRLLSIALVIATNAGGRVFIDEIENGLHYSILPLVWRGVAEAAARYDCQVFATTHSRECIAGAHEGIADEHRADFRYIRLHRGKEGIEGKIYDHELLGIAIEQDLEVR
jgi:hypothetical protein